MPTNLKKIEVHHTLGELTDVVNALVKTLRDSRNDVGDIDNLETINADTVVAAVNSLVRQLRNTVGEASYFTDETVQERLTAIDRALGDIAHYEFIKGTSLLGVLDNVLKTISDATGDSSTLNDNLERIENLIDDRSRERLLSAEDFGIVSNSTEDQTEKVLAMFNHAAASGDSVIYFPPGTFVFRSILINTSNLTVRGSGKRTVFRCPTETNLALFRVMGGQDSRAITQTVERGSSNIDLPGGDSNFVQPGDWVQIIGNRSLSNFFLMTRFSPDEATAVDESTGSPAIYYSEFNRVRAVTPNRGELTLHGGISSATVTSSADRRNATITKITGPVGIRFEDFTFESSGVARPVSITRGRDIHVKRVSVYVDNADRSVTMVQFPVIQSYGIVFDEVSIDFTRAAETTTGINIAGSEGCIVRNSSLYTVGIGVHITTGTNSAISRQNSVVDTRFNNAQLHGVLEEGTHDTVISGCTFNDFITNGVRAAGRRTRVENSTFTSSRMSLAGTNVPDDMKAQENGVQVWGRGAQQQVIIGNTFMDLDNGVSEVGPIIFPKDYSGLLVTGNTFTGCRRGFYADRETVDGFPGAEGKNDNFFDTTVIGNTFSQNTRTGEAFVVGFYANGFKVIGNTFYGNNIAQYSMYLAGLSDFFTITDNSATGYVTENPVRISNRSNDRSMRVIVANNLGNFSVARYADYLQNYYNVEYRSIHPALNDYYHLGGSIARWRDIWLINSPNVSSDRRLKSNIKDEALGLDFVRQLAPRAYERDSEEDGRIHHGFIAQEVEEALQKYSNVPTAMVTNTDDNYGLSYEQLIAPMARAIQELAAEVDALKKERKQ